MKNEEINGTYKEQILRIIRCYKKLPTKPFVKKVSDTMQDNFINFCLNAWHLKDYLKNDIGINKDIRSKVEGFVGSEEPLMACGDFANIKKHYKIDRNIRIDADIKLEIIESYTLNQKEEMLAIKYRPDGVHSHSFGGTLFPVQVIQSWNKFLLSNDLAGFTLKVKNEK